MSRKEELLERRQLHQKLVKEAKDIGLSFDVYLNFLGDPDPELTKKEMEELIGLLVEENQDLTTLVYDMQE